VTSTVGQYVDIAGRLMGVGYWPMYRQASLVTHARHPIGREFRVSSRLRVSLRHEGSSPMTERRRRQMGEGSPRRYDDIDDDAEDELRGWFRLSGELRGRYLPHDQIRAGWQVNSLSPAAVSSATIAHGLATCCRKEKP
jgi:hypothetical protein